MMARASGSALVAFAAALFGMAQPCFAQTAEDADYEPDDAYVLGNVMFFAYHEAGHMLVSELGLRSALAPDMFPPEVAEDGLATLLMMADPDEREEGDEWDDFREAMIEATAEGWEDAAWISGDRPPAGRHPPDSRRAQNIYCLLVGSDPAYYADLEPLVDSAEDCEADYEAHATAWAELLEPSLLEEGDQPSTLTVSYGDYPPHLARAYEYLWESDVLQDVADDIREYVRLPNPVRLRAASCNGRADATWSARDREMVVCYELVQWFIDQDRDNQTGNDDRVAVEPDRSSGTGDTGNPTEHAGERPKTMPKGAKKPPR